MKSKSKSKSSLRKWFSKSPILMNMDKILYSRAALYFIFAISLFQLFIFTSLGYYYSTTIFILVGFLTTYFSKNMLVVLTVALVVSTILTYGTKVRLNEGFEGKEGLVVGEDKEGSNLADDTDNIIKSDVVNKSTVTTPGPAQPKTTTAQPKTTTAQPKTTTSTSAPVPAMNDAKSQQILADKQAKLKKITDQYSILTEQMTSLESQSTVINNNLSSVEKLVDNILKMIKEEQ